MSRIYLFILIAGAGLCVSVPAFAQTTDDLIGSWARSDEAGRIGAASVLGFVQPTCNDVWNATDGGVVAGQARGSFRISRLGEQWRIGDQEPNISFFADRPFSDIATEELAITANEDGTSSIGWGGETFELTVNAAPDGPRITVRSIDGTIRHYARCPAAPGAAADSPWTPPEKTRNSYLRCSILYDLLQRAAGAQGDRAGAEYYDTVKSRWSAAASDLPSTADFMADYQTAFAFFGTATSPDIAAVEEYARFGGPPPTTSS